MDHSHSRHSNPLMDEVDFTTNESSVKTSDEDHFIKRTKSTCQSGSSPPEMSVGDQSFFPDLMGGSSSPQVEANNVESRRYQESREDEMRTNTGVSDEHEPQMMDPPPLAMLNYTYAQSSEGIPFPGRPSSRPIFLQEAASSSDINFYYACYGMLGEQMFLHSTYQAMIDGVIEYLGLLNSRNKSQGMHSIERLSTFPQIQHALFAAFKDLIMEGMLSDTLSTKELACEILRNLSRCNTNKLLIHNDLGDSLLSLLDDTNQSMVTQRFVIGTINNVATYDTNASAILNSHPNIIQTILRLVQNSTSTVIRERAVWTLQSLASADTTGNLVLGAPGTIHTLTLLLMNDGSPEMQEYALEAIRNIAKASEKGHDVLRLNHSLANQMLHLLHHSTSENVRRLAKKCLNSTGFDGPIRESLHLLVTLCVVRSVPRLGIRTRCLFRVMPTEIIRRIAEGLFGSAKAS